MPYELRKTVVLVGLMGAGKTAVGRSLARELAVPFIDQDGEIETASNSTIPELFRDYGEAFFRDKESQVLERLLLEPPFVLSTGGGAFVRERNREAIARHGIAVWLNADLTLLWNRVRHRAHRPLLRTENPFQTLKTLHEARCPVYALAPVEVRPQPGWSTQETALAVIAALMAHPDVLRECQNVPR